MDMCDLKYLLMMKENFKSFYQAIRIYNHQLEIKKCAFLIMRKGKKPSECITLLN